MTRSVVTVRTDTPIAEAAALLAQHQITSMPVLNADGRVFGMLSEADLIRDRMPHDPRNHPRTDRQDKPDPHRHVGEVMSDVVICLGEHADTADLAALMLDNNLRAIPITDGPHLLGIVSRRDLLRTLLRPDADIIADLTARLDESAGRAGRWKVTVEGGVATLAGHFESTAERGKIVELASAVPGVVRVHVHPHRWG